MPHEEELLTPDSLPLPREPENNLWYVRPSSSTDVTMVFLHGIFSSRSCWLHTGEDDLEHPAPVFWPDLVRADHRLGSLAIYLGGYYTQLDAGDYPITQCSNEILSALQRPDVDGTPPALDSEAIVFVCHSMGGSIRPKRP